MIERLVVEQLVLSFEFYSMLHWRQIDAQEKWLAIDVLSVLIHIVEEEWESKKLANTLFMDIKGAFEYLSRNQLFKYMIELGIDRNLVGWTKSFLTKQKILIIINGHENKKREIETGIL